MTPIRPLLLAAALVLAGCARNAPARTPAPAQTPAARAAAAERAGPRPLAEVTRGTRADSGLFVVHQGGGKLLFEVPDSVFGRDLLLVSSIASVPANLDPYMPAGYGAHEQVIRMERNADRVLLRKVSFEQVAADSLPIAISVGSNNFAPILASLPIQAFAEGNRSVVIDVTQFFERDTPAISGLSAAQRTEFGVRRLDETRSFINYARAFPLNVDVRHTLTFEATKPPSDANTGTLSMEMHQSMVLLPREPMRPRYADERVGFFAVNRVNFGISDQKAATESFVRRWRMEPKDVAAYARGELSEPVKPIVYWLDPATPAEWRSCVKRGVEDWQGPFETAGFRNAIVARDAPTPQEDPEWSPEDVRHSVVRWAASLTRNAQGPSVSDPRSGEIIESDIVWYHNHLRSYRNRIVLETGAANPLARSLPIDQGLMCEAMRAVIAHEVGHALGLPHNMGASSAYPTDSLRSPAFVRKWGLTPTIMDYARQNYIAQPGDGMQGTDFIRKMGPYDHFVINWGYRALPQAPTAEAERPILHGWVMEHDGDPVYRYGPQRGGMPIDPSSQTEDLGGDPVASSRLAIANLKRVAPNLVAWTTRSGEDYADLAELYRELQGMYGMYVNHTLSNVGGVYENRKTADQAGAVYTPVPRERQRETLRFLANEVWEAPVWLNDPAILSRIDHTGGVERIAARQAAVLNALLDPARLQRLVETEARVGAAAYRLPELLDDVRRGVWADPARGDAYRRALQRAHLERLAYLLTEEPRPATGGGGGGGNAMATQVDVSRSEIRPLVRAQMVELRAEAGAARRRTTDRVTQAHLDDVVARIDAVLEDDR